ncbi:MAG TPA: ATP-binding cassette domain-containing protein [Candidatus Paceibacterota bacterium]|nr:ATP-binding cassette domain-containing protein [Candidatus Paceibacterota bacterium]
MNSESIVAVENFQMKFGKRTVIEDLSFEVFSGEVFGFLGSNGSGKTTTIRTLLGIYEPTRGKLLINGKRFDSSESAFLGYLPEERGLYKKESVLDTMVYFGELKNLSRTEARKTSLEYLDRVGLADKAHKQLGSLSGGQQQKIQLGVTMMNHPALLILDEPTKGLDPVNRRLMVDMVNERVKDGATVILVTHHMDEVERLCDRVMLLKDGFRRLYGTLEEIRKTYGGNTVRVRFSGTLPERTDLYRVRSREGMSGAELLVADNVESEAVLKFLANMPGIKLASFEAGRASLEDLFVDIYSENEKTSYA